MELYINKIRSQWNINQRKINQGNYRSMEFKINGTINQCIYPANTPHTFKTGLRPILRKLYLGHVAAK